MANNNKKPKAKWTIMIYMAADDATAYNKSFGFREELLNIGILQDQQRKDTKVNILLQAYLDWDTTGINPNYRARRFKIKPAFEGSPEMELSSEVLMGTSAALTDYIKWCKKEYEAEKYLLLLWGHGTGSGMFSLEVEEAHAELKGKIPDFTLSDLDTGRRISLKELLDPNSSYFKNTSEIKLRISYTDENNLSVSDILTASKKIFKIFKDDPKYTLSTNNPATLNKLKNNITSRSNLDGLIGRELNEALKKCFGTNGDKLDLLISMGCCMQMVEYGYEIEKYCHFHVASEELIFFEGYNYIETFRTLIKKPDMSALELGSIFILQTKKKDFYTKERESQLAISCVNLEKNNKIAVEIDVIAKVIVNHYDKLHPMIRESRLKCSHFGESAYRDSFIDLIWFLEKLEESLAEKKLYTNLRKRINRLIEFIDKKYIIKRYIGERKRPKLRQPVRSMGGHGVAIYFPSSALDQIDDEDRGKYFNIKEKEFVNKFSKTNAWNKLIVKYMNIEKGREPKSIIIDEEIFRQMNLIEENIHLKELIAEYI